ncbi:hypothetical protein EU97_1245 [Prochlorococcus marinus str. MIT 9311]|nr:hypothetical protein EU97_1245 [Prochlorococcus marinus str. MIT 9311]
MIPFDECKFKKPASVIKFIFLFLEKLSFSPPRYCFKPIKNFPFLISVLRSTFSDSSATRLEVNLVLIIKIEINPKNKFKKVNLSFISSKFPYQLKTLICTNAYKGLDYPN